jgi:glycosyltransferase involved in cell wall biosynthesis
MDGMNRITVIVPALNEAGNIRKLVEEIQETLPVQVIVVDNGSTDGTGREARSAGGKVISEPRRGYGYACQAGVHIAQEAEILVFIDADFSFLPSELPLVLAPLLKGEADLVLGARQPNRMEKGAMPAHQQLGNWLAARMLNLFYGLELTDIGPYRAIKQSLFQTLDMSEMTYGWPVEMVAKAARNGARIVEIPVSYRNRRSGRSKVSGTIKGSLLAGWFIIKTTLRYAGRRKAPSG